MINSASMEIFTKIMANFISAFTQMIQYMMKQKKMTIRKMKDEANSNRISEFAGLKSTMCSCIKEYGTGYKRVKGIQTMLLKIL